MQLKALFVNKTKVIAEGSKVKRELITGRIYLITGRVQAMVGEGGGIKLE